MIKWPFSGWHIPSTLQRRLFKFVLQRAIGQFLASEIDLNNLDVQLGSGSVTLRDLDLNVLVLNELLAGGDGSGSLPPSQINQHPAVPFEIIDGRLGSITVTIPWVDIWNGNCTLEIQDFVLTIVPLKDAPKKEQEPSPRLRHKEILSSSIHLADKFIRTEGFHADDDSISSSESDKPDMTDSVVFTAPSSQDAPDGDASSMDGIQVLATLIDKIMSKIRITAKNTVVRIKHQVDVSLSHNAASPSPTPTNTTFTEIQIPYLSYVDETPATTMSSSVSGSVQDSLAFSTVLPPIETIKLIRISSLNVRIHQWNQQTSPQKDTSASDSADLNDDDVYNLAKLPPPSTSSPIVLSVSESTENWIRIEFRNESKHASSSGTDDSDSDEEDIYDLKSDTSGKSSHYEVDFVINDMCGVVTPLEFKVLSELWEVINQSWPSPSSSPAKPPNPDSSTQGQPESQPSQVYDSDSDVSPSDRFFDMSSESTTTFATSRSVMFGQSSVYSYAPESSVSFHSTSGPPPENRQLNETEWTSLRLRFNLVNFSLFLFEDLTHNNPSPVSLQSHLASRSQFYRQFFLSTSAAHLNSPSQQQQPQPTQKLYEPFIPESSYLHHNHLRFSIHNTVLKYISSSPQSSRPSPSVDASISKFRIHEYIHSHPSHLSSSTPTSQYAPILTFAPTILNSYNPSTLFPTFIPDTFESSSLLKRFHVELKSQNPVGEFVSSLKSFHPSGPLSPPEAGAFSGTGSILQPMGFINPTQSLHSPISPKMNLKSAFKGANDDIRISYSPSASRRLTSTQNETTVNDPPFVVTMLPVLLFMDLRLLDRLEKLVYPFPPSLSSLSLLKSRLEERELKFSRMWEEEGEADTDSERMEDSLLDDVEGDLLGPGNADGNKVDGEKGDTKWKVNCDLARVWVGVPMVVDDDASPTNLHPELLAIDFWKPEILNASSSSPVSTAPSDSIDPLNQQEKRVSEPGITMEWESCHAFLLPEDSTTVSSFLTIHPSASSSSTSSSARNRAIKLSFPSSSKQSSTLETKSIQQTAFTLPAGMMDSVYIDFHRDRDRDREVNSGEKFPGIWNSGFESGAKTRVGVDAEVDEEVQIGDGWVGRVSGLGKDVAGFVRSCWTRSNYVVTTSLPKVDIQLTPSIYSTIQQLSNSFTKFSPKMLYPTPSPSSTLHPDAKNTDTFHLCRDSDEEESDPESGNTTDAFSGTGGDSVVFESQPYNERLLLPRHEQQKQRNQKEKKGVNCFMTVVCNVEEASVVLVQPDSKVQGQVRKYTLSMDDMGISLIYGYDSSPTMYTHLSTRDLTLIDTTHEHPITIVSSLFSHFHSQSPLHRPSSVSPSSSFYPLQPRQNLNLQLTYLSSYDKEVKVTENNVTMVFDKNVVRYAVQDQVWSDLIAFFAGPTATDQGVDSTTQFTNSLILFRDVSFTYSPMGSQMQTVWAFDGIKVSSNFIPGSPNSSMNFGFENGSVFCIDEKSKIKVPEFDTLSNVNFKSVWSCQNYTELVKSDKLRFTMRSSVGEIGPKSEMEITNRDLVFDVCADSFVSLKDLLNLYLDELRLSGTSVTEDFTTEPTTDRESQNTQEFVYNDVLGSLDEDAFKAPEPPESLSSSKSDELLSMTIVEDFYNVGSSFANLDIHPPIRDDGDDSSVEVDELEKNNEEVEESINVLDTTGFQIVDDHFVVVTKPDDSDGSDELSSYPKNISRVRFKDCNLIIHLYEGYDWEITRQSQFDSSRSSPNSFTQTPSSPSTNDYLGHSPSSSSSYSSRTDPLKQFYRSLSSKVDIKIKGLSLTYDEYPSDTQVASRLILKVKEFEVLDNIQSSSWKKFCSQLRDEYENMTRESKNVMVKLDVVGVRPNLVSPAVEYRLKLRVTPLKLHVDQDALNMLITFFTFTPPVATDTRPSDDDMYFQLVEIQPITTRIDYKPKHVDYGQLKSGNLIELLNFFHLEGAEMNLREVKVTGIQGWARLIEEITSTWLPHITKTQVPNVVSGVGPVRSIRNIGAGVVDLVLLPIEQYKKDGRIIKGLQKGAQSFVKTAAVETLSLGTKIAVGTTALLEQADELLSSPGTRTPQDYMTGTSSSTSITQQVNAETVSRYAEQPSDIAEGLSLGYKSLAKNVNSAVKTIYAIPMEVYERDGAQGSVKAVVKAVPIAAVLTMTGITSAVGKTLMGIRNTIDKTKKYEVEDKYKRKS